MTAGPNTFLAVFTGNMASPAMQAWMAMPEADRKAREKEGFAGWQAWMQKHHDVIAYMGGPLGKTKSVSKAGTADIRNALSGFLVVRADCHEAAAKLFVSVRTVETHIASIHRKLGVRTLSELRRALSP